MFKIGDLINYCNKLHNLSIFGLILKKEKGTYLIQWFGFCKENQWQTCSFIDSSSVLVSANNQDKNFH